MERIQRPVMARRELDSLLKETQASISREKATKEKINLNLQRNQNSTCNNFKHFQRRRSLDFGDLYHLHNLPKLSTPEWRTLV